MDLKDYDDLENLKISLRQMCQGAVDGTVSQDELLEFFQAYRDEFFKIAKTHPPHWAIEKEIKTTMPEVYRQMRCSSPDFSRGPIAFYSCSCGGREESCEEDGDGNFSWFYFMPDGSVFRQVVSKDEDSH